MRYSIEQLNKLSYSEIIDLKLDTIVAVSNFDNYAVSDQVIATGLTNHYLLLFMNALKQAGSEHSKYLYVAVNKDYKLHRFEP